MTLARVRRQLAFFCFFVCLLGAVLVAATPTFWTVSSQADFLKGDVEDLSIDSDGRMFLGPAASVLGETSAPFLWSIVAGADGTLWAGSGNEGKVLKIARDGKVTTFFDAPELEVHAIVAAPQGGLYVATSPDGKIYSVAADGTSKTFFDPEDKYIWALATDASGNLFAATGDKGVIYKITPDGNGARFYKAGATNVVSLATTRTGELIAGTESPGRVFRIDAAGKAFVLLDSPFREIHALRLAADGTIYAAALSATPSSGVDRAAEPLTEPSRSVTPSVSTEITGMSVVEGPISSSTAPSAGRSARRPGRGAIYRIRPDGLWDTVWDTGDDAPYDLIVEDGGSLLVGTGTEGKIFRLAGNPARATLLARAAARQVTALLREPSGRIVGATSNPGKVFALSSTPARKGTYESDVRDAGTVATWGAIRWRATGRAGQVQIVTRSGNTATPDRDLERVVERLHERRGRTDRQPERPLSAVARNADERQCPGAGADLGYGRIPAAQPPARGDVDHRASVRGRCSSGPSLPATRRLPASKTTPRTAGRRTRAAPPPAFPRRRPHRSAAASIRKVCRRSSGRRTIRTTTACSTTPSTGGKARPPGRF